MSSLADGVVTRCSRRERSDPGSISWARFCSEAKQEVSVESPATCGRVDYEAGACNITYSQTSGILGAARQGKRRAVFEWDIGQCRPERQHGARLHLITVTASGWQVGMGAKFVSFCCRGGLILCGLVLVVLRVRSPAFQIRRHDRLPDDSSNDT